MLILHVQRGGQIGQTLHAILSSSLYSNFSGSSIRQTGGLCPVLSLLLSFWGWVTCVGDSQSGSVAEADWLI